MFLNVNLKMIVTLNYISKNCAKFNATDFSSLNHLTNYYFWWSWQISSAAGVSGALHWLTLHSIYTIKAQHVCWISRQALSEHPQRTNSVCEPASNVPQQTHQRTRIRPGEGTSSLCLKHTSEWKTSLFHHRDRFNTNPVKSICPRVICTY